MSHLQAMEPILHGCFSDGEPCEAQTRVRMDHARCRVVERLGASALACERRGVSAGLRRERPQGASLLRHVQTEYGLRPGRRILIRRVGVVVEVSARDEYQLSSFRLR